MSVPSLVEKIVALHGALADIPHAFGGALALGYHAEPRSTIDIDVNVFVPIEDAESVLSPLRNLGIEVGDAAAAVARDGQGRVMWGRTPVDLFFSYDPFHAAADRAGLEVPFSGTVIRVLSPEHLTVCKVVFDRPQDWVDIDAMIAIGTHIDAAEVLRWVGRMVGDDDPRYDRIAAVLTATA